MYAGFGEEREVNVEEPHIHEEWDADESYSPHKEPMSVAEQAYVLITDQLVQVHEHNNSKETHPKNTGILDTG